MTQRLLATALIAGALALPASAQPLPRGTTPAAAPASALPRAAMVPGGVARIDLGVASSAQRPAAWFGEARLRVVASAGRWQALVGLPLDLPPGQHEVRARIGDDERIFSLRVADKKYAVQRITLADDRRVRLSAENEARAEREAALIATIKRSWSAFPAGKPATDAALRQPVDGRASGNFGVRRIFNGEERAPHAAIDIAAARGSAIHAAAAGVVVAVGDYFFSGNTVFIDHGEGLLTLYAHLDRVDVASGDRLAAGQTIGSVGATGRASGPHLHWGVILNGNAVDPRLFVASAGTTGRR